MTKKFDKFDQDTLVERIVSEQEDINSLDMSKSLHRTVLLDVIEKRPHLVTKINEENNYSFLSFLISEQPKSFIYLKPEQYFDEIAQLFLKHRLEEATKPAASSDLQIQQSLDGKLVFTYLHTSTDDEKINYYDNELMIPLSLKSSFKIDLKLIDSIQFINKVDIHVTRLGKNKVCTTITDLIANEYKSYLINYIKENNTGFYKLNSELSEVENGFKEIISKIFAKYGLEVRDFVLKKIAIPEEIQHRIEDQLFEIRRRKADIDADLEIAKISLQNYETKIALQEKYPNAEHSLTEYEKDLALKRYLIKMGKMPTEQLDHSINIEEVKEGVDQAINQVKDNAPDVAEETDFKKLFTIYAIIFTILALMMTVATQIPAFIIIDIVVFIIIGVVNKDKLIKSSGSKSE